MKWLRDNSRPVIGVAMGLLLFFAAWWIRAHTLPSSHALLLGDGPSHEVSLSVAVERRGFIWVRAYNGTERDLGYGSPPFHLQQSWGWFLWLPYFNVAEFIRDLRWSFVSLGFDMAIHRLPVGQKVDDHLPISLSGTPAPPGRYRVCFRYRPFWGENRYQSVCSAPFWLP